nr:hypothetical protein [Tanacetum cinerariifolium]
MADMNSPINDAPAEQAPAIAPLTRTDDQIFPSREWVPIGKSNYVLDVQKSQKSPIFQVFVAIIKNTNFFKAFTASSMIPQFTVSSSRTTCNMTLLLGCIDGNLCMPISDALLIDEIKRAPYYDEYLGHVTKYQQYLNEEHGKAKEEGVIESPKATKVTKPKAAKQTRPSTPKTPKHTSSQPSTSIPTPSEPFKKYQDEELALTDSESESDKGVLEINAGDHDEGHAGPNPSEQNEGQARSNPGFTPNINSNNLSNHANNNSSTTTTSTTTKHRRLDPIAMHCNLPAVDMKEILQQRMFKDKSYEAHEDHKNLFDALEKSLKRDYSNQLLSDLKAAHQKKRKRRDLPRTSSGSPPPQPPPPPPSAGAFGALGVFVGQESSSTDSMMNDDSIPDEQVQLSNNEDTKNDHLPNADTRKDLWKPFPEEERPATLEPTWTIPSPNVSDTVNNLASTLVSTYEPPAENLLLAKIGDMTTFMN